MTGAPKVVEVEGRVEPWGPEVGAGCAREGVVEVEVADGGDVPAPAVTTVDVLAVVGLTP